MLLMVIVMVMVVVVLVMAQCSDRRGARRLWTRRGGDYRCGRGGGRQLSGAHVLGRRAFVGGRCVRGVAVGRAADMLEVRWR